MEKLFAMCKKIVGGIILLAVFCYSMFCFIVGGVELLQNFSSSSTIVVGVPFLSAFIFSACEMLGFADFMAKVFDKKDR